eukprot:556528_1
MGDVCTCSKVKHDVVPDIDEKQWRIHIRKKLLPSSESEKYAIHLSIITKDLTKLKHQLKQHNDKINELDHHGYSPLHLAVLLKYDKAIDLLLKHYASPIICSTSGWSPIQEAISTKQFKIYEKLANALTININEYSKQNITKLYTNLTTKTDFYIEIKLETFAKGLSGAIGHYFPSDILKIWKKNGLVRIDMTLLEFDYNKKQWIRGNISNIFIIKQQSLNFYSIDHEQQSIDLQSNKVLLNVDNIDFDIFNENERKHVLLKPVQSRRIDIKDAKYKRQKNWIGYVQHEMINGLTCSVYKATDIQFITKYRNEHVPDEYKKQIKNESNVVSLLMSGNDNYESDNKYKDYEYDDIKCDYIVPDISVENYEKLKNGDVEIKENISKYDGEESFLINTVE